MYSGRVSESPEAVGMKAERGTRGGRGSRRERMNESKQEEGSTKGNLGRDQSRKKMGSPIHSPSKHSGAAWGSQCT